MHLHLMLSTLMLHENWLKNVDWQDAPMDISLLCNSPNEETLETCKLSCWLIKFSLFWRFGFFFFVFFFVISMSTSITHAKAIKYLTQIWFSSCGWHWSDTLSWSWVLMLLHHMFKGILLYSYYWNMSNY